MRILLRTPLPEARSVATDIRWAGDDSVYVSWYSDGVAEVGLQGARRRTLVPDLKTFGGMKQYLHLAVSPSALLVAPDAWTLAWRPLKARPDGKVAFQRQEIAITSDLDLSGDRVVLLGIAKREKPLAPRGDVAWVGTLSSGLADLKPVLRDAGGAGAPNFNNCGTYQTGAVRFLADQSFVVVPGFQDGVHLFAAGGQRVRSWTNEQVGIDTHVRCSEMTEEEEAKLRVDDAYLERWVKTHHMLDDVLPLPEGPGLLVRSWGSDGQAHWKLKVLRPEGIKTYTVPVTGRRVFDRLRGDVRNGKIVLLLSNSGYPYYAKAAADLPAEILLMELPGHSSFGSLALTAPRNLS